MRRDAGHVAGERSRDPALVVVDETPDDRRLVAEALERRFGADYRVLTAATAAEGLATLEGLARDAAPVSLVAADFPLRGTNGLELLRRAHALHPSAARALFVGMDESAGHGATSEALQRALALGQLDLSILK